MFFYRIESPDYLYKKYHKNKDIMMKKLKKNFRWFYDEKEA